jgi:hypothetical protein
MNAEKFTMIIQQYRKQFESDGIGKIDYPHGDILDDARHSLEHCHGMLDRMDEFIKEKRFPKLNRWLGFIQGVLWTNGLVTMTDLKNTNKPDNEEYKKAR